MVYLTFGRGAAICPPEIARKEGEMIAITTCTQIRLRMLDMAGPFGFESSIKNARPGRVLPPFVAPSCRAARQFLDCCLSSCANASVRPHDRRTNYPSPRRSRIQAMSLQPGDQASDFTLPDQHGKPVTLSGLRGKTVVLDFYPWADTPACTTQACGVRDHRADYARAGAVVLGIMPEPVKRIAKFDDKYGLGFPLLADEHNAVAEAYGVWVERSRYGRALIGNERTTFVISNEGTVSAVFRNVTPVEHDELVLDALRGELELQ